MKISLLPDSHRASILALAMLSSALPAISAAPDPRLAACDVSWTEPGKDSQDSMPLGNGDISLNVWTEANGDILFYIGKSDAWSEARNTELVKVGRVRVSLSPNPFADLKAFRQTLKLSDAEVVIEGQGTRVRLWVDANAPVVRVEVESTAPVATKVTLDPWRPQPVELVTADVVVPGEADRLTWYHHNGTERVAPAVAGRTFGGLIRGPGLQRGEGNALQAAAPAKTQRFSVSVLTTPGGIAVPDWTAKITALADAAVATDWEKARAAHQRWWQDFWNRSYIYVSGDADAARVTQGYALQRYKMACSSRGAYPVKFNGSIFVTDYPGNVRREKGATVDTPAPMSADQRAWGGQYWFQNTRPMYWPRLAAGDYDLMQPLFRMYAEILKANAPSVKAFYGHDGSYLAETAPFYGGIPNIKPDAKGSYTLHYFTPVLELSAMMLDYYAHTGDKAFARETLIPTASAGLTFFAQHFQRDAQGKLLLDPDNSIEMYWKVKNPLPDIAALHWVLDHLLALPPDLVDAPTRAQWTKLRAELPPIPVGEVDGKRVLLPYAADQPVAPKHNSENPELYAVYPYRFYGVGKPDLDVALNTYAIRLNKRSGCWHQDPVQEALLGLTDAAKKDVTANLTRRDPRLRFPGFWDHGHDFATDEDNGGHGELTLQFMLMQCDDGKIRLLPAWPKEWNADFKLHAPDRTTVEGRVVAGKVVQLEVSPKSRAADVVVSAPVPASPK